MENFYENYLKNSDEQNFEEKEDITQENEEKKSKILFNEKINDLIRKKTSKENMLKIQIEKNKKNLLEKFYSLSNNQPSQNQNTQPVSQNQNKDQKNIVAIPTNVNPLIQEEQKEYDEIREKYKNERNKKKSSIFKSEDLHISNTNSVHLKKEDYSPINPNMVNQETKNNILIIQKKLFGDNEESSKVENIDEIDDLDFDDIDIKDFKSNNNNNNNIININNNLNENNNIININNENNENENDTINNNVTNNNTINNKISNSNSNINLANLDTNNINFDLSSNIKSETNDNNVILNEIENNNFLSNEILKETRAVEFIFLGTKKKLEKIKEYKKQINRTKNFSVQLVSKLDYYRGEEKDNNNIKDINNNINNMNKYKKRKIGSENREVMNDMNDFIKNLNLMNPNMNNNININNINNNININHANLAEIISQQPKLNPKKISNISNINKKTKINNVNNIIKNTKKNSEHYLNLNNNINSLLNNNYNTNTATTTNTTANKTNNVSSSKKNNYSTNINSITNNPIISSKTPNSLINNKNKPSYKKVILNNTKPILNNLDLNLNENIQNLQKVKTKAQIKINYRHISNSNLTQINSNNNSNKRKRKNNIVIINNSNKRKEQKINFYHFNTNSNNSNNLNHSNNNNNINQNNLKNIINQIPSLYKNNPLTTKNKKISMINIINNKKKNNSISNNSINNNQITKKKNSYNNININTVNKFQTINTLQKNNLIKFLRPNHQTEAIHKLKQQNYLGIYFIYAEKIKDHFLFKGIYKKGVYDLNYICNKLYSGTSAPMCINYEKYFIFVENNKMELIQTKLSSISVFNSNKSIILVKNE